jgi:sugar O-acyltransferase (sialic acid O-acetyltransferase NeuD family)
MMPEASMLPVVILGAGGHARVLIDALQAAGRPILGVVDPKTSAQARGPFGVPMLGGDDAVARFQREQVLLVNGIGGVGSTELRHAIYRRFVQRGFHFATVVHPSAVVSKFSELGDGVQVMAGCVIQCGTVIGANSIVNTCASVDHDCRIGESVHIAPGARLSGLVSVGDGAHVGTGAAVIQGVSIGRNSLVAAGAVVYRDLPDGDRLIQAR